MLPHDLLATASLLANTSVGKPRQTHLRRAVSTTYYAMFHALTRCCADLLIGGTGSTRSKEAWVQVYRSIEHGFAKNACSNNKIISRFPKDVQDFAYVFVQMQIKRHDADYNPDCRVFKSAVLADIAIVDATIDKFNKVPIKDRRAFAALVAIKQRL